MRGLLAEIVAHMQDEVVDQIERAYAKALSPLKADFEALRYEVKKLTGSSVTELQNPLLRARTQIN